MGRRDGSRGPQAGGRGVVALGPFPKGKPPGCKLQPGGSAQDGIRGKRNRREVPRVDEISASVAVETRNRTFRAKTDWAIEEDLWELNPDSSPESLTRGKWGHRDVRFGDLDVAGEAVQAGSSGSLTPRRWWQNLRGAVDQGCCLGQRRLGRRALPGSSRPVGLRILTESSFCAEKRYSPVLRAPELPLFTCSPTELC